MAKYPTTKTLKKASPTVRSSDGIVKAWDIEVVYTHTHKDGTTWSRSYPHTESDLEYLNKVPTDFTAQELIDMMNSNMDTIFDAHYEAHNLPATEEKVSSFDLNSLSS